MSKKIFACVAFVLFVAIGAGILFGSNGLLKGIFSRKYGEILDDKAKEAFPYVTGIKRIRFDILSGLGVKEYDGFFFSNGKIVENYTPPKKSYIESNSDIVNAFVANNKPEMYFTLIPTQCAIEQENLPQYAALYNQKNAILQAYKMLSLSVEKVDSYGVLFNNREKRLYYNTHPELTNVGGYYIYSAICRSMNKTPRALEEFDIKYAGYGFYGDSYSKAPYEEAESDTISIYAYKSFVRNYTVTHITPTESYSYDRLYIPEKESGEDKTDIIFGGISPVMHLEADGPYTEKLLVFGDSSVKAYLPFMINHYEKITFVDIRQYEPRLLSEIRVSDYDQTVFAMSIDSYMRYDLTKILYQVKNEWPLDK